MDSVAADLNVKMNYASSGEHVPEAERNNRTIKDRVRTTYHQLPYKRVPKLMIKKLVLHATKMLNILLAKGGISSYLSPYTLVTCRVSPRSRPQLRLCCHFASTSWFGNINPIPFR